MRMNMRMNMNMLMMMMMMNKDLRKNGNKSIRETNRRWLKME